MFARSSIRQAQPGTAAPSLAWHALSGDAVLASLCSSRQGLSDHEARARQAPRALVFRDARLRAIAAEHLVPGDVVQLDAGNKVPADVRLIDAAWSACALARRV